MALLAAAVRTVEALAWRHAFSRVMTRVAAACTDEALALAQRVTHRRAMATLWHWTALAGVAEPVAAHALLLVTHVGVVGCHLAARAVEI